MNRYILMILSAAAGLVACAAPYGHYQHGQPRTQDEFHRAYAECERKVGGSNYGANLQLCLKDAGWTSGERP